MVREMVFVRCTKNDKFVQIISRTTHFNSMEKLRISLRSVL